MVIQLARLVIPTRVRRAVRLLLFGYTDRRPTYDQDGLCTYHNADFMTDPKFAKAYASGLATGSWGSSKVHWRMHVACWAAQTGAALEGDFVECGVNKGGLARTVMTYCDFEKLPKRFWLLDTFEGTPEKYLTEAEKAIGDRAGGYEPCYEAVQRTFGQLPNVSLVRGMVPETLQQVTAEKVAFLSIDMNSVQPEIEAAEYFWDRLVPGAIVLLDDYGWAGHILQKNAFDEFARRKGCQILSLPTGQAIIQKR